MKLPIRNRTPSPLTLFIEPYCDQYEIPPEGEAIVTVDDGEPHSLDFHPDNWVSFWNEGESYALVDVVSKEQNTVVEALSFVRGWLFQYGPEGKAAAKDLQDTVEQLEKLEGYIGAHFAAYGALREGFRTKELEVKPIDAKLPEWSGNRTLTGAYRVGGVAAYFNYRTRLEPSLVEMGRPPFDTDVAQSTFDKADAMIG